MALPSNPYTRQGVSRGFDIDSAGNVTIYATGPNGASASLFSDGSIQVQANTTLDLFGQGTSQVHLSNDRVDVGPAMGGGPLININGNIVEFPGAPVADPLSAGAVYTDGTPSANTPKAVKVSGGS